MDTYVEFSGVVRGVQDGRAGRKWAWLQSVHESLAWDYTAGWQMAGSINGWWRQDRSYPLVCEYSQGVWKNTGPWFWLCCPGLVAGYLRLNLVSCGAAYCGKGFVAIFRNFFANIGGGGGGAGRGIRFGGGWYGHWAVILCYQNRCLKKRYSAIF